MKVVHIAHNNLDGAGRAMQRLHRALCESGVDSRVLVYERLGDDPTVEEICRARSLNIMQRRFPALAYYDKFHTQNRFWRTVHRWRPTSLFNNCEGSMPTRLLIDKVRGADVLCLHSVQQTVSPEQIRAVQDELGIPVVWTLLDIEPVTGGCHFHDRCEKFMHRCGDCPQLENRCGRDLSALNWERKAAAYSGADIAFAAVTRQSRDFIRKSALFGESLVEVIPLSVGPDYRPADMAESRKALGIPEDSRVLVFGCFNLNDTRKGGHLLLEALEKACASRDTRDMMFLTFGELNGFSAEHLPLQWKHLGRLHGDRDIARAYNAANVFTCPSIDDIGPMMINEAFMCGKPVVAFDTGVAPDLAPLHPAGYLARFKDTDDYARGILYALYGPDADFGCPSAETLAVCDPARQAAAYVSLFEELLSGRRRVRA
ncbi:glycosyltransferase [Salidesulfovibrio brasiliensis]|uniref:glycosyltransferase n=1 Tax=Salidesulfovibrio brasiliensis TaxID=221711 RepID=UPI0006D0B246|nr:glycosyltransferase [Salidesulfovibrio brasiliensis]